MTKNQNEKVLKDFIKYCERHPEYRFWQALRNWSGFNFILGSILPSGSNSSFDTFYFTKRNK